MKIKSVIAAAVAALSAFGVTACAPQASDEEVKLVGVTAAEVGVRSDVDYFVVPEPAASVKVGAIENLEFAGSLQELYCGENGYPQAVVVAKNEFTESSACASFLGALGGCGEWLLADSTSPETVVNAVKSHLADDMIPTFNAKNLSKTVMQNCNVRFVGASDCKTRITRFMTEINALGTDFGTPADGFFYDGTPSSGEYEGKISVYAPDGAPALGLAKMLAGETDLGENFEYNVVDASTIQSFVAGGSPKADICVLPVNLAVKMLGNGEKYKMLGTLTHGNLFLLSANGEKITAENISALAGKTVGVINLAAVPGLTFKLILKNNDIKYTELQ